MVNRGRGVLEAVVAALVLVAGQAGAADEAPPQDQSRFMLGAEAAATGVRVAVLETAQPEDVWTGKVEWLAPQLRTMRGKGLYTCIADYNFEPRYPLRIRCEVVFSGNTKLVVALTPTEPFAKDVAVSVDLRAFTGIPSVKALIPRQDGLAEEVPLNGRQWWTWPLDGAGRAIDNPAQHLAIPAISLAADGDRGRVQTLVADPWFTTTFEVDTTSPEPSAKARWVYLGSKVPMKEPVTRTFWNIRHNDSWDGAMKSWYNTALADVPKGPDWLHTIDWQHYDYLSYGGRGWFEDIDAVEKLVAPEDRGKVLFTLHGWYDLLGRYTFDAKSGKLADSWTAFPNAAAVREKGFNVSESVPMTKADMHRRIRYAKDRGFRVCLYFADGLTACEQAGVSSEEKRLAWGGWQGPDTLGRSYTQNPAHPDVYRWYVQYLQALLAEYGNEIDALVWDETFMIRTGMLAPPNAPEPAYLCAPFMRLVKELTQNTTDFRKDLAFLSSDDIGMTTDEGKSFWTDVPPYAIMAHGCYQDSHSRPQVWPYGIFPNFRNTLWSCNWAAVTNFAYTRFGVEHYDTPVATSNGWLDSKGVARLTDEQRQAVLQLFTDRKSRPQQLHWLTGPPPVFSPDH